MDWKEYQEKAASFFRDLGLEADTDVRFAGVRTTHDIDVLVKSHHVGFDVTWVVECKRWRNPVSKLHVLALREIVSDVGADRGILLSESGFQSGAVEAAKLTNVQLTSLADMQNTAKADILSMKVREFYDVVVDLKARYWAIPKATRVTVGLRPESGGYGYSANVVLDIVESIASKALRGTYPIEVDPFYRHSTPSLPEQFDSLEEVLSALRPHVSHADELINRAEQSL
jgi:hypothetical protein